MERALSELLKLWRAERPDEWIMDEFIREAKSMEKQLQNTSSNNDYMKCLDDIWDIVSVNLRSGKWDKSEFEEILKKHFA